MRAYPTSVSGCPVSRLTNVLPFPSFPLSMMGAVQHVTRGPAYVSKRPYPPGLHAPYQNGKGKKTCPRLLDWRMRKMPLMSFFLEHNHNHYNRKPRLLFSIRLLCNSALSDVLRHFNCRKAARYRRAKQVRALRTFFLEPWIVALSAATRGGSQTFAHVNRRMEFQRRDG